MAPLQIYSSGSQEEDRRRRRGYICGESQLDALFHFAEEPSVPLESVSIHEMK
jgi:hypothetical protein